MNNKNLFIKKSNKNTYLLFILIVLIFFFSIYIIFQKRDYFILKKSLKNFYFIPFDKGGEKVKNINKKSLNLNKKIDNFDSINDITKLKYSIQIYTSSDYEKIKYILDLYINKKENIYKKIDFFVLSFDSDIGNEYILLYKNFTNRKDALYYCTKFVFFETQKCLIVNTQKFNN